MEGLEKGAQPWEGKEVPESGVGTGGKISAIHFIQRFEDFKARELFVEDEFFHAKLSDSSAGRIIFDPCLLCPTRALACLSKREMKSLVTFHVTLPRTEMELRLLCGRVPRPPAPRALQLGTQH